MPFGRDNLYFNFMESDPEGRKANYFSFDDQFGRSPNQKRFFQQQFEEVQNKYLGRLGRQVRGGGEPTQELTSYLTDYFAPGGGAQQEWGAMSPGARGQNDSRFAPPARWVTPSSGWQF